MLSRLATLTTLAAALAALGRVAPAAAAKDSRTFAVLRFHGDGPLTVGRTDPIVSPGGPSAHVHVVQGGNAFGNSATGETLMTSNCSTADIAGDKSAYWMPRVYFRDPQNGSFEPVPLFYMNVYYFFEATNDDIKAFPVGLQMVSGNAGQRTPPATGNNVLDPSQGTIQPAQFTCPRSSYVPPSYPAGSNGSMAGIQDTGNLGAGAGFPFAECDGYASPLRADLHFPSCYDPSQPLTAYRTNTVFPTDAGDGKQDCPAGWLHMPHIFFEMYFNTPLFVDRWDPAAADSQPFVLANGDAAGFSLHGDFMAAWDTEVLQTIIDTCDAGDAGMDKCPGIETVLTGNCNIPNPTPETIDGVLAALPGNNPLFGWQYGTGSGSDMNAAAASPSSKSSVTSTTSTTSTTTSTSSTSTSSSSAATTPSPSPAAPSVEVAAVSAAAAAASSSALLSSAPHSSAPPSSAPPSSAPSSSAPPSSAPPSSVLASSAPSPRSSSGTPSPSSQPTVSEQAVAGCLAPTDISTTVVTVAVTSYSTATSTIYTTTSATMETLLPTAGSTVVVMPEKRGKHLHRHVRRH